MAADIPQLLHIQRYPTGLLDVLGSKTGGMTPNLAEDRIRIMVDGTEFYAQATSRVAQGTAAVAALGFGGGGTLIIPTGQLWRVRSVTNYTAALGAGVSLDLQPAARDSANTISILCGTTSDAGTVGIALSVGWDLRTPRIFTAGWQFGSFVRNLVAGPVTVTTIVDYDLLTG